MPLPTGIEQSQQISFLQLHRLESITLSKTARGFCKSIRNKKNEMYIQLLIEELGSPERKKSTDCAQETVTKVFLNFLAGEACFPNRLN